MIGVQMYHDIKSLKSKSTVRNTAKELGISTGTVQKYAHMDLNEAFFRLKNPTRTRKSQFDEALPYIEQVLTIKPDIPAEVLHRKIKAPFPHISSKVRAFRNYLKKKKKKFNDVQPRYYHPVKTSKEDSQVQVDIGEIKIDYSNFNFNVKIYFVVFVFSYSRMMYISYQDRPYKTEDFIKAHLEAFHYFGGVAKEYVYDQTKLVVINEKYREVWLNEKFSQFALRHHFTPTICEGYDPESKGKVERAIGYIKRSFLSCEVFKDIQDVRNQSMEWLNTVANCRIHATIGRRPEDMFEEEKPYLNREIYLQNSSYQVIADKTNLISYKGNKYSVPYIYQGKKVSIYAHQGKLFCHDIINGKQIAEHEITYEKYKNIICQNHYISPEKKMAKVENQVMSSFDNARVDQVFARKLINRIKHDNHNFARFQLLGLSNLIHQYPLPCWQDLEKVVFDLPKVKISVLTRLLDMYLYKIDFESFFDEIEYEPPITSSLDRSLDVYMKKLK
jgi:transposase